MSDEQQELTYEQALIERLTNRIGRMATQIEGLVLQLESAQMMIESMNKSDTSNGEMMEEHDAGLQS